MKKVIVIGGSAGSFRVVSRIMTGLPPDYPYPVIVCVHRLRNVRSEFARTLSLSSHLPVKEVKDKEKLADRGVYISPANYHLIMEFDSGFSLSVEPPVNHSRPSIDVLMDSLAEVFGYRLVAILLSGANNDGSAGMKKIHDNGGFTIVQDPATCDIPTMPLGCIQLFKPSLIADLDKILDYLVNL